MRDESLTLSTSAPESAVPPLSAVATMVRTKTCDLLGEHESTWAQRLPGYSDLWMIVRDFVARPAKRLRSALCLWTFLGVDGDETETPFIWDACVALELLQAFVLMHDDLIDRSSIRRGLPSIHVQTAASHEEAGWRGSSNAYGESVAMLAGDLKCAMAHGMMRHGPPAASDIFLTLMVETCFGQYAEVAAGARRESDTNLARTIATYKSAKYSVEGPLHLGAAIAGTPVAYREPLSRFAIPLGCAFQLRDDVLPGCLGTLLSPVSRSAKTRKMASLRSSSPLRWSVLPRRTAMF